jgi:shikimate dehydrogenase
MAKNLLGLIGFPLGHSFSKKYFTEKFQKENISDFEYLNFEIDSIDKLEEIIKSNPNLLGLNVTIPYKETVIPKLNSVDEIAKEIGAVNTIKITSEGHLLGFNTDWLGFSKSLKPFLEPIHERALILGTGGASKAVAYALEKLGVQTIFVSRKAVGKNQLAYSDINENLLKHFLLIVNTTPVGTFPAIDEAPEIDCSGLSSNHLVYDLIYNPQQTLFLKKAKEKGATAINGLDMLKIQAEEAWKIFNEK